jgi:hypothetical protein
MTTRIAAIEALLATRSWLKSPSERYPGEYKFACAKGSVDFVVLTERFLPETLDLQEFWTADRAVEAWQLVGVGSFVPNGGILARRSE